MAESRSSTPVRIDPLQAQYELQKQGFGIDPDTMSPDERAVFFTWNVTALMFEIGEAGNEIGWKPWASARFVNRDEYVGELADAFHFMLNLLLISGVTWEEFVGRYMAKRDKNFQRQAEGYDGVTGKCPECHRDIAESRSMHPHAERGGYVCLA